MPAADGSGLPQGAKSSWRADRPRDLPGRGPRHQTAAAPRRRSPPRTGVVREVRQEVIPDSHPTASRLPPSGAFMNRRDFLATLPAVAVASQLQAEDKPAPAKFGPDDWPWWRGPTRDGVAATQTI